MHEADNIPMMGTKEWVDLIYYDRVVDHEELRLKLQGRMEKERNKLPDELARQEFDSWDGTATAPQMANEGAAAASINSRRGLVAAARMASDQLDQTSMDGDEYMDQVTHIVNNQIAQFKEKKTRADSRLKGGTPQPHEILPATRARCLHRVLENKPVSLVHYQKAWFAPLHQLSRGTDRIGSDVTLLRMTKDVDPVLWSSLTNVDVTFKQDLMILIQLDNDFKVVEGGNTGIGTKDI